MNFYAKVFLSIVAVLFLALLIAFETKDQEKHQPQSSPQQSPIHLRFGHNTPVDSALHQAALRFASEVLRKTEGQIIIDVYPEQKLGNDYQMVEMARRGELDILLTPTAKMSVAVPSMQYADLPFYFPTRKDLYEMLDGESGEMILRDMRSIGLIGVTFWENGFKHFTANFPILSPSDLKGKKIRVMKSRIIMEQFESMGAFPIPIDFHATKEALRDKVVDAQENPLVAIVSMGFHEVQTDLTLSEHAFLGYVLSFSDVALTKLPSSLRSILIETAKEVTPWEREETQRREIELLNIIAKSGVQIHALTQEQRKEFMLLMKHIPEQFEELIGTDVMSKSKELLYYKYGAFLQNEDHILIGINADVSLGGAVTGLEIKRGVELAASEINAKGGILSKPLKVILKDHRVVPSRGIQNIEEFKQNPNLVAIIGGKQGSVILEEIETIQRLKIPYLIPWAAVAKLVDNGYEENYLFRLSANDELASSYIIKHTIDNFQQPAIIVENSIWGRENLRAMQEYLAQKDMKFSAEVIFNRGQTDFSQDFAKIQASGAKSIILIADTIEGTKIIESLSREKIMLPIVSHWGIIGGDFFEKHQNILSQMNLHFFQTGACTKKPIQVSQKLLKAYNERYKTEKMQLDSAVAQAYDLTQILALAITKAQSIEGSEVKKALENLPNYEGIIKNYAPAFTEKKHDALNENDFYMAKFTKDGQIVSVDDK